MLTLLLDRRYRERDEEREARYSELLKKAEQKATDAADIARRATDEAEAKTRARIDFLMSLIPAQSGKGMISDDTSVDYQVLEILMNRYDEEELKALAFEAGVRWETLAGDKPVSKALSLVKSARNTNRMHALVMSIRRDRPEAFRS
jgi:hypothetical protein